MSTLAGNEPLSIHLPPHRPRPFHLPTENEGAYLGGNGHQSAYFRADTININKNNRSYVFLNWIKIIHQLDLVKK